MTETELSPTAASVSLSFTLYRLSQPVVPCCERITRPLHPCQSVNMRTVEMDTARRVLRSVMERTLDTRRVIHIFQGEHIADKNALTLCVLLLC